jgi:CMP-N-acetylneuraminic acid synthetase
MKGLILARGGSVGVPQKNLQPVGGTPLVVRAAREAKRSGLEEVYVYSDSSEILSAVSSQSSAVPVPRPPEVSGGAVSSEDTVLRFLRDNDPSGKDDVCLIQCTTPFLRAEHLNQAVAHLKNPEVESAISVCHAPRYFGYLDGSESWVPMYPRRWLRQQYRSPMYMENGGFYASRRSVWEAGRRMGRNVKIVVMGWWESMEIDDPQDMEAARRLAPMFG